MYKTYVLRWQVSFRKRYAQGRVVHWDWLNCTHQHLGRKQWEPWRLNRVLYDSIGQRNGTWMRCWWDIWIYMICGIYRKREREMYIYIYICNIHYNVELFEKSRVLSGLNRNRILMADSQIAMGSVTNIQPTTASKVELAYVPIEGDGQSGTYRWPGRHVPCEFRGGISVRSRLLLMGHILLANIHSLQKFHRTMETLIDFPCPNSTNPSKSAKSKNSIILYSRRKSQSISNTAKTPQAHSKRGIWSSKAQCWTTVGPEIGGLPGATKICDDFPLPCTNAGAASYHIPSIS